MDAEEAQRIAIQSELDHAVVAYHDDGDLAGLAAWVEKHPEHPDHALWEEVVALRVYESVVIGDPWSEAPIEEGDDPAVAPLPEPSVPKLRALVERYPNTVAAKTATAVLEAEGLRRLTQPPFNDNVVAFLEGNDDWVRDDDGRSLLPNVDLDAFRSRHEDTLRTRLGERLVEDGCTSKMGYCTWYVQAFPQAPVVTGLTSAMKDEWYRRAHPRWRGKRFANCTYKCAKRCQTQAEPLDDACYAPCFSRCEAD